MIMKHWYYMGRGEAIGVMLSVIFTAPLFTILMVLLVGWWGLLTYPLALASLLTLIDHDLREKARRWDTSE